jgi:hypothetical protein
MTSVVREHTGKMFVNKHTLMKFIQRSVTVAGVICKQTNEQQGGVGANKTTFLVNFVRVICLCRAGRGGCSLHIEQMYAGEGWWVNLICKTN